MSISLIITLSHEIILSWSKKREHVEEKTKSLVVAALSIHLYQEKYDTLTF